MSAIIEKTKGGPVFPAVVRVLKKLGQDISLTRRSRRISTEEFAAQMGVSRDTLRRLESGDAGCSLNTLASALHALGMLDALRDLLDQSKDDVGLMIMRQSVPQRVKRRGVKRTTQPQGEALQGEENGW